ncbi:MAG TPA: type II toxin-antitoxin system HicA family toxin [Spirochaetota bacterium]|nr:type II toxin-antitoxin system HicA family toxin [Spirochaetota bacterium]HQO40279.1 type II toxin-antitoxin system HicA family toxin [Spirochaetota bacterium]
MTGKELVRLLVKNNCSPARIRGSHHILVKGRKTLSVPVHANRDLPRGLLSRLKKDGGLT